MTPTIHDRLTDLTPRMLAYARTIQSPELDADDLYQEMALAIVERDQRDPAFLDQQDAYLTQYGTWQAKHAAEKSYSYHGHVTQLEDAAGMYCLLGDDPDADPVQAAETAETIDELLEMVQALDPKNQQVVRLLYCGYSESEIARELHISRPAVSQRKRTIARALAEHHIHL